MRKDGLILTALIVRILFLFFLLWLANWAALQAMDQPFPRWPALFLTLMLKLSPSRCKQLFSNLWVTHPILQPRSVLDGSPTFSDTQSVMERLLIDGFDPGSGVFGNLARVRLVADLKISAVRIAEVDLVSTITLLIRTSINMLAGTRVFDCLMLWDGRSGSWWLGPSC